MPVIRITDATWDRLKRWAVPLEDSPDDAVRKVLDAAEAAALATQANKQIYDKEYVIKGEIYRSQGSTWEIGHFKGRNLLPFDKYLFVEDKGIDVTLVIRGKEYPAHFHHYKKSGEQSGEGYIGRSTLKDPSIKDILDEHSLAQHKMLVTLRFRGHKVYLEPQTGLSAGICQR